MTNNRYYSVCFPVFIAMTINENGKISADDALALIELGNVIGLDEEEIKDQIEHYSSGRSLADALKQIEGTEYKELLVYDLMEFAYRDKNFSKEERTFIKQVSEHLAINEEEVLLLEKKFQQKDHRNNTTLKAIQKNITKASKTIRGKITDVKGGVSNFDIQEMPGVARNVKKNLLSEGMTFKSLSSLQPIVNVVNEAGEAVNNKRLSIKNSAIPDVIAGALGAGVGGAGSFAALYGLGVVGLSAPGITSGLAAVGGVVGGGMAAGVFVLAAPAVILSGVGVAYAADARAKHLKQEKERLLKLAVERLHAINKVQKEETNAVKERADYLNGLNILLQQAIKELRTDVDLAS